jgi:hypothetical protein
LSGFSLGTGRDLKLNNQTTVLLLVIRNRFFGQKKNIAICAKVALNSEDCNTLPSLQFSSKAID